MKVRNLLIIFLLAGSLVLAGCNRGNFTVLTNKNIQLKEFTCDTSDDGLKTEGDDTQHIIIVFVSQPIVNWEESLDDALENGDADMLTNATFTESSFYIPLIYGQHKLETTGTAVKN